MVAMQPELLQCRTALQRFEVALKVVVAAPQRLPRGSGTGPALTGVIDQGQGSKVGCWGEAVTK